MGKIWANVRALQLELKGSIDYPNSGPRDPWGAGTIKGNEDENDAALRRAAHRELDRILDKMIPKMPRCRVGSPGPSWATLRRAPVTTRRTCGRTPWCAQGGHRLRAVPLPDSAGPGSSFSRRALQ